MKIILLLLLRSASKLAKGQVDESDVAATVQSVPEPAPAPAPAPSLSPQRDLQVVTFPGGGCTSSACCLNGICHARPPSPPPSGGSSPVSSPVSFPTTPQPTGCDLERAPMFEAKMGRLDAYCPPAFYYVTGLGAGYPVVAHFAGTNVNESILVPSESSKQRLFPISLQVNREGEFFKSSTTGSLEFVAEEDVLYEFVLSDPNGQFPFYGFQLYPSTSESYCAYVCKYFLDEYNDDQCRCILKDDGSYLPSPSRFLACHPGCVQKEIPARMPTITDLSPVDSKPLNNDVPSHSPPSRNSSSALVWIPVLGSWIYFLALHF